MHANNGAVTVLVAHPSADLYGTDMMLLASVAGMLARGWSVLVTLPGTGPLIAELEKMGIAVAICPAPVLRKSMLTPPGLARLIAETVRGTVRGIRLIRRSRADVIYVSTITLPLWATLAKLSGVPAVTHIHEAEGSAPRLMRVALAAPLAIATSVLANSEYSAATHAEAFSPLRGRAKVVYNGVDGPVTLAPPRPTVTDGVRVLYVGRLSHRKGVDVAVDAIAELKRRGVAVSLDIVGSVYPGYENYENQLRQSIQDQGIADVVTFHGYQKHVWTFLDSCDVAVVTSRLDEGFGNTAVEAVLAERPVIVSDTSGLREAVKGYASAQLVSPSDAGCLADAIYAVATDWSMYRLAASIDAVEARAKHNLERYGELVTAELIAAVDSRK